MTGTEIDASKTCPRCAEEVKKAALVCRYCNYEFPAPVKAGNPAAREWAAAKYFIGLFLLGAIVFLLSQTDSKRAETPTADSQATNEVHPANGVNEGVLKGVLPKRAQCQTNIAKLQELGVNVSRSDGVTIASYDEVAWARLSSKLICLGSWRWLTVLSQQLRHQIMLICRICIICRSVRFSSRTIKSISAALGFS